MPCNSDYMDPNYHEKNHSLVRCGLDELSGKVVKPEWREGYHPSIYNKHTSKEELDIDTAQLCAFMKKLGKRKLSSLSLELQMWWRDHQLADKERKNGI